MKSFEEWWENGKYSFYIKADIAEMAWEARVPEGYVVVPIEPTEEILLTILGGKDSLSGEQYNYEPVEYEWARVIYKAMIKTTQESER